MTRSIRRLWIRSAEGGPMEERPSLTLEAGRGVVGDHTFGRMRHVTLIFEDDWRDAERELGADVDPAGRRANVLLSGGDGASLVGSTVKLGEAVLEIKGITAPCPIMDRAAAGLMDALKPAGRGGVWGRVLTGGVIAAGDSLQPET